MNYSSLLEIAAAPGVLRLGVDRFLDQITAEKCRWCGQVDLRRFEVLNGHCCERCRKAYLLSFDGWDDSRCTCKLPAGWRCVAGIHHDAKGAVAHRFADGRTWLELCPEYRCWLREKWGQEEARKAKRAGGPLEEGDFGEDDIAEKARQVEGRMRQMGFFDKPEKE